MSHEIGRVIVELRDKERYTDFGWLHGQVSGASRRLREFSRLHADPSSWSVKSVTAKFYWPHNFDNSCLILKPLTFLSPLMAFHTIVVTRVYAKACDMCQQLDTLFCNCKSLYSRVARKLRLRTVTQCDAVTLHVHGALGPRLERFSAADVSRASIRRS